MFNSPLSEEKAGRIISGLNLESTSSVVDVGCGEGEFLAQIYQRTNADCLGVDIDAECIALANQKSHQHRAGSKLRFVTSDIQQTELEHLNFDLAVCIGSTHAFGEGEAAYPNALKKLSELIKPKGLMLLGEGYWKQNPDQAYLDFIGDPVGIYNSHEQNIEFAKSVGLIPLYSTVSNQDEWDHFEWCFLMEAERKSIANPHDEAVQNKLKEVREWNLNYRKFGKTTMGFGFYLYLKAE